MHRVVIDTNIILSAMLTNFGPAAIVMGLVFSRRLDLAIDERILDEYDDVLGRPRFGIDPRDRAIVLERIRRVGQVHLPQALPGGRAGFPDPTDVVFLELALGARADWLVTRNEKHFPKSRCGNIVIITPEQIVGSIDP